MASPDKELEEQLREAGKKLSQFPTEVDELLPLLDNVEKLLAKVEQSPSELIQNAYSQSMKALLAEPLLRHTDADVQVAVASCISEITRITAPEAPYNDDQMKEVFQLIVSSFEDLSDMSSRSYDKRASILETVAKVRSCVVMLDLECDGLISEMFQHFLSLIRDYHPECIFTSMETIMTLVLEESEDVSLELLTPILASLKRDNEEISTVARKLGESVFAKCAVKLKPYLKQAVKSLGLPLDAYSKIVATICNGSNSEVEHTDGNVSVEQLDAKERVTEEPSLEEVSPKVQKSVKSVLSNGMTETGDEEMSNVSDSLKKPDEGNLSTKSLDININKHDTDDLDTGKSVKVESRQVKTAKRRGKKSCSTQLSDPLRIDSDNEAEITCQNISDKGADELPDLARISVGEDPEVDTRASPDKEQPPISPPKQLDSEVNVSFLSPNKSLPDESPKKVDDVSKKKDNLAQEDASMNSALGKAIAGASGTEIKPENHSEKKKLNLAQEDALSVDSAPTDVNGDFEVKPQKHYGKKKGNFVQEHESSKDPADGGSDLKIKPQKLSRNKKGNSGQEDEPSEDLVSTKVYHGSSDSEIKAQRQSGKKIENLPQEDVQPVEPLSPKVDDEISDSEDKPQRRSGKKAACTKKSTTNNIKGKILRGRGTSKIETEDNSDEETEQLTQSAAEGNGSDSETRLLMQSGKGLRSRRKAQPVENLPQEDVQPVEPLSPKVDDEISDSEDKPQRRSGKKAACTKKTTSRNIKGKILRGRGTSKIETEDNSDEEAEQLTQSAAEGNGSDSETRLLMQSGKGLRSRRRAHPPKKSGKGNASETKLSSKKQDAADSETNGDGSDSESKPLLQSVKEITSRPSGQPLKNSGKGNVSGSKLSSRKEDTTTKDKDSSDKDNSRRRAHGTNAKERVLSKSQAKDDDQDMIISPKSTSKLINDEDRFEGPKVNSKRKRTPGKDKVLVSGDLEYGANLIGARVKVWWPDDKQYYEGIIESFDPVKKKHKVSYTDGDEEILVLQQEKWELVDDGTMQEDANEVSNPDSSAKSRIKKKAKTNSEQSSKQTQMDVSPRSGRGGAAASSKSKGTATRFRGKVDSKSKNKTSKTSGKSEENSESDDEYIDDVPGAASKSKEDDGMPKFKDKSKLETPRTATMAKVKTPQSDNTLNGTGKTKSSSITNSKEKSPDSGKTPETAKLKSADTSKAGKSRGKSGKKRRRGF